MLRGMRAFPLAALIAVSFVIAVAGGTGCDDPPLCYDGEFEACFCAAERGYRSCAAGTFGECVCNGDTPGLPGGLAEGGGGAGGAGGQALLPFLSPCDDDDQCESTLCHNFIAKGRKCSQPCDDADDCPAPSPGCNMMGVCKAP